MKMKISLSSVFISFEGMPCLALVRYDDEFSFWRRLFFCEKLFSIFLTSHLSTEMRETRRKTVEALMVSMSSFDGFVWKGGCKQWWWYVGKRYEVSKHQLPIQSNVIR